MADPSQSSVCEQLYTMRRTHLQVWQPERTLGALALVLFGFGGLKAVEVDASPLEVLFSPGSRFDNAGMATFDAGMIAWIGTKLCLSHCNCLRIAAQAKFPTSKLVRMFSLRESLQMAHDGD